LDTSYRSIFLGIPSDKKPKGQKNIFGDFMIAPPTFKAYDERLTVLVAVVHLVKKNISLSPSLKKGW
jgi:hypothetical protein